MRLTTYIEQATSDYIYMYSLGRRFTTH